jgi:hypothetical protein
MSLATVVRSNSLLSLGLEKMLKISAATARRISKYTILFLNKPEFTLSSREYLDTPFPTEKGHFTRFPGKDIKS